MKLFCLPYAGGSSSTYFQWKDYFSEKLEIVSIELPGRGTRLDEPLITNFSQLVEEILQSIIENIDINEEFQLFGHSLGGLLAYSVSNRIEKLPHGKLNRLYLSATRTPDSFRQEKNSDSQSSGELLKHLSNLGGIPHELTKNQEFLDYFLPIIQADFSVIQSYSLYEEHGKPAVPTVILNGNDDETVTKFENNWANYLQKIVEIKRFKGNHFFINKYPDQVCRFIHNQIQ
ncbi:thioesterase II family protein [Enterococcus quebecensis]|uniref:Thioesterase domain-containing protein n=1 Tax=Enterococcus quebecensis TaxID=903983 RepID=A0A1E5GU87_9ENTE|nr:alpha/beta fold hydrolase [Enterococcus quebecensis]OEG16256.1 hypothetical protein BCR23_05045 [Enterococcus quebecensis]OJG74470.1 hypothetical protein RV12_GL002527 [Enterococcus quebecensis]